MPRGDGTGPQGYGPRTGRGCGPCGWGYGFHHGPCWGSWHRPSCQREWTKEEERETLEDDVKNLEEELKAMKERLAELK